MGEQRLRVAASTKIWVDAHRRHLGVIARRHALAGHRGKATVDTDAEEAAELMRARTERAWPREFDKCAHLRCIGVAKLADVGHRSVEFRLCTDHLLASRRHHYLQRP